nr:hypothetical protein [Salegentibacter tibetensis]
MENTNKPNQIGTKITRIPELCGMKQDTPAEDLGIPQQSVSHIEQSETIEEELLQRVSKGGGISLRY